MSAPSPDSLDPQPLLAQVFGFAQFRPGQEEIVRAVINGDDVLAIMPTGGGKSLCFQLPALVRQGLTVVLSPLLALMRGSVVALSFPPDGFSPRHIAWSLALLQPTFIFSVARTI